MTDVGAGGHKPDTEWLSVTSGVGEPTAGAQGPYETGPNISRNASPFLIVAYLIKHFQSWSILLIKQRLA